MDIPLRTVAAALASTLGRYGPDRLYTALGNPWGKDYLNLGFWDRPDLDLEEASNQLVREVGRLAGLSSETTVLDVGFGFGRQDLLWAREFDCRRIYGINITPSHLQRALRLVEQAGLQERIQLQLGDATAVPFGAGRFERVIALECAFHFKTRQQFFQEAHRVLKPGGRLVTADIIRGPLHAAAPSLFERAQGRLQERFWHIPVENRYGVGRYRELLQEAGFRDVLIQDVSEPVLHAFARHYLTPRPGRTGRLRRFLMERLKSFCLSGYFQYIFASASRAD